MLRNSHQDASGDLSSDRLLLGRERGSQSPRRIGFTSGPAEPALHAGGAFIADPLEGHCLVVAPTAAGKGRHVIIPNALTYRGPMFIIDPKGEAAAVSGPHRARMGQSIYFIDPFAPQGSRHGFNPLFDLDPRSRSFEASVRSRTRALTGGASSHGDPFWDNNGESLLAGVIAYTVEYRPPEDRNLTYVRGFLCDPDLSYKIAVILDGELNGKSGMAAEEFRNFLGHEGEKVRTSVRSTAVQHLGIFADEELAACINRTSFTAGDVIEGRPVTIYFVIPPARLEAYAGALRLWVSVLMDLVSQRTAPPEIPTLFILDELAQLGSFPMLRPAVTLMRSYGLKTMLILQDLSQLRAMFPVDYSTIVNNCATFVTFGHTGLAMSNEISQLLCDVDAETLFDMPATTLAIRQHGQRTRLAKRIDYLTEPDLTRLAEPNPFAPRRAQERCHPGQMG
jgi:type IV secretion system protein VirD4